MKPEAPQIIHPRLRAIARSKSRDLVILFCLAQMVHAVPGWAHDTWLVTEGNVATPRQSIRVAVVTGDLFPFGDAATDPSRIAGWVIQGSLSHREVTDFFVFEKQLATTITLEPSGIHVVGLALHPKFIEIEAAHFNEYLADEKAGLAIKARQQNGDSDRPGREYYTKFAKTYVEVSGEATGDAFSKPLGHRLEIVPLNNPCRLQLGEELRLRVLFEGQPARSFHLKAGHEGLAPHSYAVEVDTDEDGVAAMKLTRTGLWFVRTHTIHPLSGRAVGVFESSPAAEWESFWASITFSVRESGEN